MILSNLRSRVLSALVACCMVCLLAGCADLSDFLKTSSAENLGKIAYRSGITLRYQYSQLTERERRLYSRTLAALSNGNRFVDVAAERVSSDVCKKILNAVLCDSPDLFWVSRNFVIQYEKPYAKAVYFRYFDGETLDDFDVLGDGSVSYRSQADQAKIRERIANWQAKTEASLALFQNKELPDAEIAIHDWLAESLVYDKTAAETVTDEPEGEDIKFFDRFTAYGAMLDKTAVCEGYAKLFQYLCLRVGINATQVSGSFQNEGHMWNAVSLPDGWYFVDVTFDDMDSKDIACLYSYLNINLEALQRTHAIVDTSMLSVPNCVSEGYNYCKKHLINLYEGKITAAYEEMIERDIKAGKGYITVYFPNGNYSYKLLQTALYSMDNSIADCIKQYGKSVGKIMTLESNYAFVFLA